LSYGKDARWLRLGPANALRASLAFCFFISPWLNACSGASSTFDPDGRGPCTDDGCAGGTGGSGGETTDCELPPCDASGGDSAAGGEGGAAPGQGGNDAAGGNAAGGNAAGGNAAGGNAAGGSTAGGAGGSADVPDGPLTPVSRTDTVQGDSDDPAIWIHPTDPSLSLILGTDKDGLLFVFDLEGNIVDSVTDTGWERLNNVDIEYGLMLDGEPTDIAVMTDRDAGMLRVVTLPDLEIADGGGVPAFDGTGQEDPMGIGLYKRPSDGAIFAIVSRKEGPDGAYLWQYLLEDDGAGNVAFTKVREFGAFSGIAANGLGEIEAVAVDDELGYVYYSDEVFGILKYHADPDAAGANSALATFGTSGFDRDREGISIYTLEDGRGYILVSDQQADEFRVFPREGTEADEHDHPFITALRLSTLESDGSEVTSVTLNEDFESGLFVAMSNDRTFQYYAWDDLAGDVLERR
jgi:3-phytase